MFSALRVEFNALICFAPFLRNVVFIFNVSNFSLSVSRKAIG